MIDVGILGFGTLGRALASGLRTHAEVGRIRATKRTACEAPDGVELLGSNAELVRSSDVVMLCTKPGQVEHVMREIAPHLHARQMFVSGAASVSIGRLRTWSGARCTVMRAMPNMPCRIGYGMTALADAGADAQERALVESLFATLGEVCWVEEHLLHAVTGLSGCSPAYAYVIVEALSEAGVKLGLPRKTALQLAAQTLFGSAKMVLASGEHPAALKDEVTTPAGCTIDGLMALEEGKLRSTLLNAVIAAAERSASLSAAL